MKLLIIDQDKVGLPFALRALADGHQVKLWCPLDKSGEFSEVGKGLVDRLKQWQPWMSWADLIFLCDNSKYRDEIERYFVRGFPIFGCNKASAELELNRALGQKVFQSCGIETAPFEVFKTYRDAIKYVENTQGTYVSKPWGGNPDKSLSFVSRSPDEMIFKLTKWESEGRLKGEILLQEKIDGTEMAAGGWFGPGGWSNWVNENWEEKRLMNQGLGDNTGEMGTVMQYTKKSKLFKKVLEPCTEKLAELGYVGYVDVNCMVNKAGTPFPMEFTMRPGWPHFNLTLNLHQGDSVEWMADILEGRNTLDCSTEICLGVVIAHGDFPRCDLATKEVSGYPIEGIKEKDKPRVHLTDVKFEKVLGKDSYCTAGPYVMVVTGQGETVQYAQNECYDLAWKLTFPSNRMFRTDIGDRLKKDLPELQKHGYATGMEY